MNTKTLNNHSQCARIVRMLAASALMTAIARSEDYYWNGANSNINLASNWRIGAADGATATAIPGVGDNIIGTAGSTVQFDVGTGKTWNNFAAVTTPFTVTVGSGTLTLTGTLFSNTNATTGAALTTTIRGVHGAVIDTLQMNGGNFQTNNSTSFSVGSLEIGTINFVAGTINLAVTPLTTGANGVVITSTYSLGKINISGAGTKVLYLANNNGSGANQVRLNNTVLATGIADSPGANNTRIIASTVADASDTSYKNNPTLEINVEEGLSYTTNAGFQDGTRGILIIRKTGAGTQVLSGTGNYASNYTGGTELVSGTLGVGHASALGTGTLTVSASATLPALALYANNIALAVPLAVNGDALLDSGAFSGTLSGALGGAAAIIKAGPGTLSLTGDTAHYTGAATVQAGVLRLAGAGSLDTSGTVTIAAGATLAGSLARAGGRALAGTGTLAGNLTLAGGSLLFDITAPGFAPLFITGTLASAAGGNTIGLGTLASGTFDLIKSGTINGAAADYTVLSNGAPITARNDYHLTVSGTGLVLDNKVVSLDLAWTGADGADGAWESSATGAANWTDGRSIAETHFNTGDRIRFDGTDTAGNRTIAVAAGGVTASEMTASGGGVYTFTGGAITTSGASVLAGTPAPVGGAGGKFIKLNSGTVVFQNSANVFSGGIETSGGVIAFNNSSQLGDGGGGILFSDDATLRADAGGLLLANTITIAEGRTATIDTQGHALSYSGTLALAGTGGTLAKTGAGRLLLTEDNAAYAGGVAVNAGSLILAPGVQLGGDIRVNAAGAVFGGQGGTLDAGADIADGGVFQVGGGAVSGTLTVGGTISLSNATIAFNLFEGGQSDALIFGASGTVVLSGSNTVDFHPTAATSGTFFISTDKNLASAGITIDRHTIDTTSRQEVRWDTAGTDLSLVYGLDTSRVMTWTGSAADGKWNTDGSVNWGGSAGKTKFLHGDAVRFDEVSGGIEIDAAGARVASIDINTSDAATLTFTGQGIQAGGANATGGEVADAGLDTGRLVKRGAGALVFQNAGNLFDGGIDISGGLIGFNDGAQLQTGTAAIHFTGDATLRADDIITALAGPIVIDGGRTAVFDTQGYSMTLTGSLGGAGTAVKAGAGMLTYSGAASLGHAATRVGQGTVKLDGIAAADAPAVSHAFVLDGGWVDLSDTGYDSTGATAGDWAGLVFTGSAGGVIGGNDKITLRAGDARFGIGGEPGGGKQGVFVVVDAGADGVATMTGANNYAGYTMLRSGTLRISGNNQLGSVDDANREVVFDGPGGAVLEITAGNFTTTRAVELRAGGGLGVAGGATATWAGEITGTGALAKTGAGTLVLTASTGRTGPTVVRDGTLEGHAGSLRGDIAVDAGAALAFSQTGTGIFAGRITGGGETTFKSGEIQASAANVFSAGSIHSIAAGATLNLAGFNQTVAGLRNNGAVNVGAAKAAFAAGAGLTINGDYHGGPGSALNLNWKVDNGVLLTDAVEITGQSSGETRINFIGADINALNNRIEQPVDFSGARFLMAGPDAADVFYGEYFINYTWYELGLDEAGNFTFIAKGAVREQEAALGVELAALFTGKAAYEALGRRLSTLRRIEARPSHKWDFWVDGVYRHDRMSGGVYDGVKIKTQGMQAGADYAEGDQNSFLLFGVFADYVRGNVDVGAVASAPTESDVYGYGVYGTYRMKSWYLDIMVRASTDKYRVDPSFLPKSDPARFDLSGCSFGGSVGTGYAFETASGWHIEPQLLASYQLYRANSDKDAAGHNYNLDDVESLTGRAGVLVARPVALGGASRFLPYVRLGVEQELGADTRFTIAPSTVVSNDLSGTLGTAEIGMALRLGAHFCVSADAGLYHGDNYDGYSVNFGLRLNW
ncbi:MAG: autotransporter domain-containing protein [Opitutaceae bacterium]|jgi:outer membrane autotransporter protein|nr:autotransporter domain-containing protein [Opitutaceae bacterium]